MDEAFLWDSEETYEHLQRLKDHGYTVIKVLSTETAQQVKALVHQLEQHGRGMSNGYQIRIPDIGVHHPLFGELLVNLQAPTSRPHRRPILRSIDSPVLLSCSAAVLPPICPLLVPSSAAHQQRPRRHDAAGAARGAARRETRVRPRRAARMRAAAAAGAVRGGGSPGLIRRAAPRWVGAGAVRGAGVPGAAGAVRDVVVQHPAGGDGPPGAGMARRLPLPRHRRRTVARYRTGPAGPVAPASFLYLARSLSLPRSLSRPRSLAPSLPPFLPRSLARSLPPPPRCLILHRQLL